MRIIGYSYDATIVCPPCACCDYQDGRLTSGGRIDMRLDEHGIPDDAEDYSGNTARPVFSTDEFAEDETCGVCFDRLAVS